MNNINIINKTNNIFLVKIIIRYFEMIGNDTHCEFLDLQLEYNIFGVCPFVGPIEWLTRNYPFS